MTSRRVATALLVVLVSGCGAGASTAPSAPPSVTAPTPPAATPSQAAPTGPPAAHADHHPPSSIDWPEGIAPVRIEIPAIGVDAEVVELGMVSPTEMQTPEDFDDAGWWTLGRRPGEIGPAVVAGHVDSTSGPAVFHRLSDLQPGDEIVVHAVDGQTRTFVVEGQGRYPKDGLPDEVFGFGRPRPELRLITCGGTFDRATGHYRDNVVVYAAAPEA